MSLLSTTVPATGAETVDFLPLFCPDKSHAPGFGGEFFINGINVQMQHPFKWVDMGRRRHGPKSRSIREGRIYICIDRIGDRDNLQIQLSDTH